MILLGLGAQKRENRGDLRTMERVWMLRNHLAPSGVGVGEKRSSLGDEVSAATVTAKGEDVRFDFKDGAAFHFHALWLRDACRDDEFVKNSAGERILANTPIVAGVPDVVVATSVTTEEDGKSVLLSWNDGKKGSFGSKFLRAYASVCAEPVFDGIGTERTYAVDTDWLMPFSGLPDAVGQQAHQIDLWTARSGPQFKTISFEDAMTLEGNLRLLENVIRDGVVKVTGIPNSGEKALHEFAKFAVGGLQKDPSRKEANWKIERKEEAASISYNPEVRLNNHTDQSLPNHGTPGLFLIMHYVKGHGANTLVDTFAVAEALKKSDPEAFRLLSLFGNDQERDLLRSRQDAKQNHTQSLYLSSRKPIFQLDSDGGIIRSQYNEVFRMPSTVPYALFKEWYRAYMKFAEMVHSPEFERSVPMNKGEILMINNWRVLHGRAGSRDGTRSNIQSFDRVLVGGTVTRETFFSRARALIQELHGTELHGPLLLS